LYELEPTYEPTSEVSPEGIFRDVTDEGEGMHRPDGIFLAWGPDIVAGCLTTQPVLADLAPTILYALSLPVPAGLDGRVLSEIFDPAYMAAHPVSVDQAAGADEVGGPVALPPATSGRLADEDLRQAIYSAEDERLIRERLMGLGYLS
jgi:hypothetical protein